MYSGGGDLPPNSGHLSYRNYLIGCSNYEIGSCPPALNQQRTQSISAPSTPPLSHHVALTRRCWLFTPKSAYHSPPWDNVLFRGSEQGLSRPCAACTARAQLNGMGRHETEIAVSETLREKDLAKIAQSPQYNAFKEYFSCFLQKLHNRGGPTATLPDRSYCSCYVSPAIPVLQVSRHETGPLDPPRCHCRIPYGTAPMMRRSN